MRSLIISLALFLCLCVCIVFNFIYINKTAGQLYELIESLQCSTEYEDDLLRLERLWEKSSGVFGLSVSYREIDHFGETLLSLRAAFDAGNSADFGNYRLLLIDAVDEISRLERFSVDNLL